MSNLNATNESICSVCGWENDPKQLWKPDLPGGANEMSLNEARHAFHSGKPVK